MLPSNIQDREMGKFVEDTDGNVSLRTTVIAKDIQIGAVEIKDYTTDTRVSVNASHELLTKNSALEILIGEVQATPTANTLLDRLKTIADAQLDDGHNVTVDNVSIAVTGSFYQTTQPISVATLPLPSGAATSAKQLADGHNVSVDKIGTGTIIHTTVPVTATGNTDLIVAAETGHHWRIKAFSISSNDTADSEVELRDGTSAKFKFNIPKDGGNVVVNLIGANWDLTTATKLSANTAGVTDLHINISYEDITE